MDVIQVSFVKPPGTMILVHSTIPFAGTLNSGPSTTISGLICQPSAGHWTGGGASFASPSAAPASAHLVMVSIRFAATSGHPRNDHIDDRRTTAAFFWLRQRLSLPWPRGAWTCSRGMTWARSVPADGTSDNSFAGSEEHPY